jgi:transcription elongation factor Elf1
MVRTGNSPRWSGGFSLDDAARLHRRSRAGTSVQCPTCGGTMRSVVSEVTEARVRLLHCDACRRSVVLEQAATEE